MLHRKSITLAVAAFANAVFALAEQTNIRAIIHCRLNALEGSTLACVEGVVLHTLQLTPGVRVWKGQEREGASGLRHGDMLDIKMEPAREGGHRITYIWANLVKLDGLIASTAGNRVQFFPFAPHTAQTSATSSIVLMLDNDTELTGNLTSAGLTPRSPATVIGLLLEDGTVKATRIILSTPRWKPR